MTIAPTGTSAVKFGNWLKKTFQFNRNKFANNSNPYSDDQSLSYVKIGRWRVEIVDRLLREGWQSRSSQMSSRATWLEHKDGGCINIEDVPGRSFSDRQARCHITVFGKKKAKPTTIPYYD